MRRLSFEVISQLETKSGILVKINKPKQRGEGGSPIFFLIGILLFVIVRSLYKISEPYDNPFWDFSNGSNNKKRIKGPFIYRVIQIRHPLDPLPPPSVIL